MNGETIRTGLAGERPGLGAGRLLLGLGPPLLPFLLGAALLLSPSLQTFLDWNLQTRGVPVSGTVTSRTVSFGKQGYPIFNAAVRYEAGGRAYETSLVGAEYEIGDRVELVYAPVWPAHVRPAKYPGSPWDEGLPLRLLVPGVFGLLLVGAAVGLSWRMLGRPRRLLRRGVVTEGRVIEKGEGAPHLVRYAFWPPGRDAVEGKSDSSDPFGCRERLWEKAEVGSPVRVIYSPEVPSLSDLYEAYLPDGAGERGSLAGTRGVRVSLVLALAVLATLGWLLATSQDRARESIPTEELERYRRARNEVEALSRAVAAQIAERGRPPASLAGLDPRLGARPPVDPWGNAYRLERRNAFVVVSDGSDGRPGGTYTALDVTGVVGDR